RWAPIGRRKCDKREVIGRAFRCARAGNSAHCDRMPMGACGFAGIDLPCQHAHGWRAWMDARGIWVLAPVVLAALAAAGFAAPPASRLADMPGSRIAGSLDVDVELVLAVDISYSMDPDELALQRDGYVEALTSPEFLNALGNGMHGRIAVT